MINKVRSLLYKVAKILGDVNAIRRGKIKQRIKNRVVGRYAAKRIFK